MYNVDKARSELQEILNGEEYAAYQDQTKNILQVWWEKAKQWIADQLAKLFPSFETTNALAGPILIIMIIVAILALTLVAFFIIRNNRRNRLSRDKAPLQSMKEMNWSHQMHLAEARKQEALGEYSAATRHMFLALLLYFHENEWLEARVWKTNWEYYDELKKVNQQWAEQFYYLALVFDEVTYGERKVDKEEYSQFRTNAMKRLNETDELLYE